MSATTTIDSKEIIEQFATEIYFFEKCEESAETEKQLASRYSMMEKIKNICGDDAVEAVISQIDFDNAVEIMLASNWQDEEETAG
jgi:hypothetical protein